MSTGQLLPEWAPVRAVMMAWPHDEGDWEPTYKAVEACYWTLIETLAQHVDIWLLLHESIDPEQFNSTLREKLAKAERVSVFPCAYNDTWIRDYAPLSLSSGYLKCTFNGWGGKFAAGLDNIVTVPIFDDLGIEVQNESFVCEGGALETNGKQLLINDACIVDDARNPALELGELKPLIADLFGYEDIICLHDICLSGDDTDGHIDTLVRFVNDKTLVYSGPNDKHPDAGTLDKLEKQLEQICNERGWRKLALPTPVYLSTEDRRVLPCTYANFLICNGLVFVPIYGIDEDEKALGLLKEAFEAHEIVSVRCEALLEQHGSLHCATMQIAQLD